MDTLSKVCVSNLQHTDIYLIIPILILGYASPFKCYVNHLIFYVFHLTICTHKGGIDLSVSYRFFFSYINYPDALSYHLYRDILYIIPLFLTLGNFIGFDYHSYFFLDIFLVFVAILHKLIQLHQKFIYIKWYRVAYMYLIIVSLLKTFLIHQSFFI